MTSGRYRALTRPSALNEKKSPPDLVSVAAPSVVSPRRFASSGLVHPTLDPTHSQSPTRRGSSAMGGERAWRPSQHTGPPLHCAGCPTSPDPAHPCLLAAAAAPPPPPHRTCSQTSRVLRFIVVTVAPTPEPVSGAELWLRTAVTGADGMNEQLLTKLPLRGHLDTAREFAISERTDGPRGAGGCRVRCR